MPALDRVFAYVAVAAEDLDRPFGGPHRDATGLERRHRGLDLGALALAGASQPGVELLLATQQAAPRHSAVAEDDLARVGRPDAHLLELGAGGDAGRTRRHDERRLTPRTELGLDGG